MNRVLTIASLILLSTGSYAQVWSIQGAGLVCADQQYTYTQSLPPRCTEPLAMGCTGCYDVSSTPTSITLKWLPGDVDRRVVGSALCFGPDGDDPNNPNPTPSEDGFGRIISLAPSATPGFDCSSAPGGSLVSHDVFVLTGASVQVPVTYQKRFDYPGVINQIIYYADGVEVGRKKYCDTNLNLTFSANALGTITITTQILDQCGNTTPGPNKTIRIEPSCYNDNPAALNISLTGNNVSTADLPPYTFLVEDNETYTLNVSGVSDFTQNYSIDFSDIGTDGSTSSNTFTIFKNLGSYRINFVKLDGRGSCPALPEVKVFLGGTDETLEKTDGCPVVLPDDFPLFGFGPEIVTDPLVLNHFAGIVISKFAITVKPGLTLKLGAELILEQGPPVVPPLDTDLVLNFIQTTSYNEFNQILGQGRSYFDSQGRALQSQYKNLTDGVMLATQTLYDAQARPVINTLPAPISASTLATEQNTCGINQQVGADIQFGYKSDFVGNYNFQNFDLYTDAGGNLVDKENTPDPVDSSVPGTLGWYYSLNNGNATGSLDKINEPLVAATGYPYTRALYQRDGSGEMLGTALPGDQMRAGSGHVARVINGSVEVGDTHLEAYLNIRETELDLAKTSIEGNFFKTTATDPNGRKSLSYTDKSGNTIISIYLGSGSAPITTSYQFYDDAGRLVVSMSPNGVQQYNGTNFEQIDKTTYEYNFKGFLLAANETDAGRTEYVYRRDGSIRFSQNAEQRNTGRYSYTHYDRSGRPVESGEYEPVNVTFKSAAMTSILENTDVGGGLPDNEGVYKDRIFTFYDSPSDDVALTSTGRVQRFVHGSVSYTRKNDEITSYYSYDEQGRVDWMVQDIKNFGVKTIDYRYGSTGAVQEVAYQRGVPDDEFHHFYEYDADGRLSKVYTATQELIYNKEGQLTNAGALTLQCTYGYYLHGPLKRMEYANNIQGIDYVYTADGALKGINSHDAASDPGGDGNDLFGMTIDYYSGDYLSANYNPGAFSYSGQNIDQFGGHIKGTRWQGPVEQGQTFAYGYDYDDRYQLADARFKGGSTYDAIMNPYRETISGYDPNGNIGFLSRKNGLGASIADFTYNYASNKNQLTSVTTAGTAMRSYLYNDLGQMTEQATDSGDKLKVSYDVSGKVLLVLDENDNPVTAYLYDDRGFRLNKITYDDTGAETLKTWYIRDASGNVVTTYEEDIENNGPLTATEQPVYGNGKLGLYKPEFGITFYELTDHLGNVRAVLGGSLIQNYLATMEPERAVDESDFIGITSSAAADHINHTSADATVPLPNRVIRINNAMDVPRNPIGGGIMLWVHPGDKLRADVFVKYADFDNATNVPVPDIASYLSQSFGAGTIVDGASIFTGVDGSATGVFTALGDTDDTRPKAFLSYIVFDKNMVAKYFSQVQVSTDAQIPPTGTPAEILAHQHEHLVLDNIQIDKEGYIYVYVSNQTDQNMDVYFDDLLVTHEYSDVVAGGDYYPFGLAIEDRQITREKYRYGYQGQFSEKDDETGWNHFELREYDPVIGRWLNVDPAPHLGSPYAAMGNNPIRFIDERGDTLGLQGIIKYDQVLGTNYLGTILADLTEFTGLILSPDANNNLQFATSSDGSAFLLGGGSEEARRILIAAIEGPNVDFFISKKSVSSLDQIGLSPTQIQSFISGAINLDNRTLGWGMTFLHEVLHTKAGLSKSDKMGLGNTGPIVDMLNIVRQQLNGQGYNFGQRATYQGTPVNSGIFVPFDQQSLRNLRNGQTPSSKSSFIKLRE